MSLCLSDWGDNASDFKRSVSRGSLASSNSESSADEDLAIADDGDFEEIELEEEEGEGKKEGTESGEAALPREYILNSAHLQDVIVAQKVHGVGVGVPVGVAVQSLPLI